MYDNIQPMGQQNRDNNRAHCAQESPSGTVTEFSQPHIHNDGSHGFDGYEYDTAGQRDDQDHDHHQFTGTNQPSLQAHGVEQQSLISGKLNQQAQSQFGGVNSTQDTLNQY
jgi:hypothetical protein